MKSLYTSCAQYYDLLVDKKEIEKEIIFISKLLGKFNSESVLDLGCGTGLYLYSLKKREFEIEGLDLSKEMLLEAKKKNKKIKLYNQSMLNFEINKKYDAIICLSSSLLALPNFRLMQKSLKKMYDHINSEGILILDMPNHNKEIKECNKKQSQESKKFSGGILNSTFLSYNVGKKWREEWVGEVKEGEKVIKFKDIWEEIIYSPKKLEESLEDIGFKVLKVYGSMKGGSFDKSKSWRRVYLCQKSKN